MLLALLNTIVLAPLVNLAPGVFQRQEPMRVETLLPQAAIEAFHLGVIRRLARTAEVEFDAALIGPFVHDLGNESLPLSILMVAASPLRCNAVERIRDIFSS